LLVVRIDCHGTLSRERLKTCDRSQEMGPNAIKNRDGESAYGIGIS
jgi:hypothetical protein